FAHNSKIFSGLSRISGPVDEIAANHDECRPQATRVGDGELEIGGLLRKLAVGRVHPELWVRHLQEEEIRGLAVSHREDRQLSRDRQGAIVKSCHTRYWHAFPCPPSRLRCPPQGPCRRLCIRPLVEILGQARLPRCR